MKTKYGNTFNQGAGDSIPVSVETIWVKADEFYPCGAFVKVGGTYTVGTKIPAGTPVQIDTIGGTPLVGTEATSPVGLTYEDAYVGTDGCSLTVVTKGIVNESLSEATVSSDQKGKLGCITFIKEA